MINIEKTFKGIQPFRLGGGEPSGYNTGGMVNIDKPFKGIQPFRLGGGGTIRVPYRKNDQHWETPQGDMDWHMYIYILYIYIIHIFLYH